MNKQNCDICRDLLPLVKDGVANPGSAEFVLSHTAECEECNALSQSTQAQTVPVSDGKKTIAAARTAYLTAGCVLLIIGALVAISFSEGDNVFYNILIMPVIGAAAWLWFKKYAAAVILPFIAVLSCVGMFLNDVFTPSTIIWFTCAYTALCALGILIGALLSNAFKGDKKRLGKTGARIICGVAAVVLSLAVIIVTNGLMGNPVSASLAQSKAQKYVDEKYPELTLRADAAKYDREMGCYTLTAVSPTSIDTHFPLYCGFFGNVSYDGYDDYIPNGRSTRDRVEKEYKNAVEASWTDNDYFLNTGTENQYFYAELDEAFTPETDKYYDITALGESNGHIFGLIGTLEATPEALAQALLNVKSVLDADGVTFNSIDLIVDEYTSTNQLGVTGFPSDDIYEDGLVERVKQVMTDGTQE